MISYFSLPCIADTDECTHDLECSVDKICELGKCISKFFFLFF